MAWFAMRLKTILIILAALPFVLIAIFFLYSFLLSPPGSGRDVSRQKGVPFPALMAHRGVSGLAPEETRPAYLLARELGADYLEADIQRTKDGVLIALHDDDLTRTTNIEEIYPDRAKDSVDTFTYAELMKLDAGSWFNETHPQWARPSFVGLNILTLEELIDIADGGYHKPGLYLETKSPERFPGIEKQIVDLLKKRGWIGPSSETEEASLEETPLDAPDRVNVRNMPGRIIVQSFSQDSLQIFKDLAPELPRVYLFGQDTVEEGGSFEAVLEQALAVDANAGPSGYMAWPWYTSKIHARGMIVHYYTINQSWQMWLINQFGADGIFTDRIDIALDYFDRMEEPDLEQYFKKIEY
ncbi:MAG: glycerophosphodiester phosphodiesterase [Spirochaetaceae bacterium]|nr:glycerophosphodiester phosphodiesterase [Spirochaetaceae bacterium]